MIHYLFFLIFSLFFPLFAEQEGIICRHFFLEDKTFVHTVEIDLKYFDLILTEAIPAKTVDKIAEQENATAAINGGFFFTKGKYAFYPSGILKIGNCWRGLSFLPRGAIGWSNDIHESHENKKMLFGRLLTKTKKNGAITILPIYSNGTEDEWEKAFYILGGAPLLVLNDHLIEDYSEEETIPSFLTEKHPRTAIGILQNGHFLFAAVDGTRNLLFKNSGISILNLAHLMQTLGCQHALNLDGGGSSTLYFEGTIQNNPCGELLNRDGMHLRKVSNALLAIPKQG